jgi:hypothetical protein
MAGKPDVSVRSSRATREDDIHIWLMPCGCLPPATTGAGRVGSSVAFIVNGVWRRVVKRVVRVERRSCYDGVRPPVHYIPLL